MSGNSASANAAGNDGINRRDRGNLFAWICLTFILLIGPICFSCTKVNSTSEWEVKLRETLPVEGLEEVDWVVYDGNNIYIGFNHRPSDLEQLLRAWALQGNRAIDFGVHLWAVPAKHGKNWRPGTDAYYMQVTARHGKIE